MEIKKKNIFQLILLILLYWTIVETLISLEFHDLIPYLPLFFVIYSTHFFSLSELLIGELYNIGWAFLWYIVIYLPPIILTLISSYKIEYKVAQLRNLIFLYLISTNISIFSLLFLIYMNWYKIGSGVLLLPRIAEILAIIIYINFVVQIIVMLISIKYKWKSKTLLIFYSILLSILILLEAFGVIRNLNLRTDLLDLLGINLINTNYFNPVISGFHVILVVVIFLIVRNGSLLFINEDELYPLQNQ